MGSNQFHFNRYMYIRLDQYINSPYMIHKFIFGLEGLQLPLTLLPVAGMIRLLGSPNMLHCQVRHNLVHRIERLITRFTRLRLQRVDPQTRMLSLDWMSHVAEERASPVVSRQSHVIQGSTGAQWVCSVEVVHGVEVTGIVAVGDVVTRVEAGISAQTQLPRVHSAHGGAVL